MCYQIFYIKKKRTNYELSYQAVSAGKDDQPKKAIHKRLLCYILAYKVIISLLFCFIKNLITPSYSGKLFLLD